MSLPTCLFRAALTVSFLLGGAACTKPSGNPLESSVSPLRSSPPVLTALVNDEPEVRAHRGWPLVVDARFESRMPSRNPHEDTTPVVRLAAKTGGWGQLARVEVRDEGGQAVPWPFHPHGMPAGTVELNYYSSEKLTWYLTDEESRALAPGRYELVVVLDATRDAAPGAFTGTARSEPVRILIEETPAALSPEQETARMRALTEYLMLRGDSSKARSVLDAFLTQRPENTTGLFLKAFLLEGQGDLHGAADACTRALELSARQGRSPSEPANARVRCQLLLGKLSEQSKK